MKQQLASLIQTALDTLQTQGVLPADLSPKIQIDRTRDASHGDYACNIALMLAKPAKCKPRDLAEQIVAALPSSPQVEKVEIAGPGFINFALTDAASFAVVGAVLEAGEAYGLSAIGNDKSVQVEFVSANPTGPLHVGHGRGAAYGAAVSDLLAAVGFKVHREYYVNDAGRQMDILAASVWLRYLDLCGENANGELPFPVNGYKGDYVWDIAATVHRENGDAFRHAAGIVLSNLPADESDGGDKEKYIDAVIARAKELIGEKAYRTVFDAGLNSILDDIRRDLDGFGVVYGEWFSERSLTGSGAGGGADGRLTCGVPT